MWKLLSLWNMASIDVIGERPEVGHFYAPGSGPVWARNRTGSLRIDKLDEQLEALKDG